MRGRVGEWEKGRSSFAKATEDEGGGEREIESTQYPAPSTQYPAPMLFD